MDSDSTDTISTPSTPDRKRPRFWRRPKRENPAAQLEYAGELAGQGEKRKAARQYRALVHQWHDSPEAVTAQFSYSRLLEDRRKYARAFDEYQYLIHFYPLRIDYDKVLERQFAIANQVMTQRRMTLFFFKGFAAPERALSMFERIVENAPQWSRAPESRFRIGWIHEQIHEFEEAVSAYAAILHLCQDSEFAESAAYRRAYCLYEISRRSPRDEVACRSALSAFSTYLARYKGSEENTAAAGEYMQKLKSKLAGIYYGRAGFYDRTRRPKAAVLAYRDFVKKFPDDRLTGDAIGRINELTLQMEQNK